MGDVGLFEAVGMEGGDLESGGLLEGVFGEEHSLGEFAELGFGSFAELGLGEGDGDQGGVVALGSECGDGFDDVEFGAVVDLREERLTLFGEQLEEFFAVHASSLFVSN